MTRRHLARLLGAGLIGAGVAIGAEILALPWWVGALGVVALLTLCWLFILQLLTGRIDDRD